MASSRLSASTQITAGNRLIPALNSTAMVLSPLYVPPRLQYGEEPPLIASPNASHPKAHTAARADYDGRRFVTGDQSGRTSAPIRPQAVQTILGHKERTGISSGSASASSAISAPNCMDDVSRQLIIAADYRAKTIVIAWRSKFAGEVQPTSQMSQRIRCILRKSLTTSEKISTRHATISFHASVIRARPCVVHVPRANFLFCQRSDPAFEARSTGRLVVCLQIQ